MNQRTVSLLTILLALALVAMIVTFSLIQQPVNQAQAETIRIVQVDDSVSDLGRFYWLTTTEETYFTIDYRNDQGDHKYAIVARDGGDVSYFPYQDLISEEDALSITLADHDPAQSLQARLGLWQDEPVWEVSFMDEEGLLNYYYLDAFNGQDIQLISDI